MIQTVEELHRAMRLVRDARKRIVAHITSETPASENDMEILRKHASEFQMAVGRSGTQKLSFGGGENIDVIPTFIDQIRKDLLFLEEGHPSPEKLLKSFEEESPEFKEEVQRGVKALGKTKFSHFISDRDGTLEPYSPFYVTAVQSIYSAWILHQFGLKKNIHVTLLTSGPLKDLGIIDVNVDPENSLTYAGSKGRHILTKSGDLIEMKISEEQANILSEFGKGLQILTAIPKYKKFALMGSGLQRKYGEIAIARNTTNPAILEESESIAFKNEVETLLKQVDSNGAVLDLHDTGSDIEILLKTEEGQAGFSKGDGVNWLNNRLSMNLDQAQGILIAGDTFSDVPMLEAAKKLNPATRGLFRTSDLALVKRVQAIDTDAAIVSSEDALLMILFKLS